MYFRISGFTLIELMVVIVIISILSSISTVTFKGYFQKARNAKMISVVEIYKRSMLLYQAEHGSFPSFDGWSVCLGTGYADHSDPPDGIGDCRFRTFYHSEQAAFTQQIADIVQTTPEALTVPALDVGLAHDFIGASLRPIFNNSTTAGSINGKPVTSINATSAKEYLAMHYFLEGEDQNCGLGGVATIAGVHPNKHITTIPSSLNTNPNYANSGNTYCVYVMGPQKGGVY